jgi:biopolymer transport protein ExbD
MLTRGYELDVPQKMENFEIPPDVIAEQLIVTYTAQDGIYINKDRVTRDDLPGKLQAVISGRRKKSVFFAAAKELNYGDVVSVLDIVRNSGADAIGLVTDDALAVAPEKQAAAAAEAPASQ